MYSHASLFQYMLLLRGATMFAMRLRMMSMFQYMLLLRGATNAYTLDSKEISVSIHAPLARSNRKGTKVFRCSSFQYMLLLRGATSSPRTPASSDTCFNTCSSCEEQRLSPQTSCVRFCFNTCSSCEEQRTVTLPSRMLTAFQYMLLLRGATSPRTPASSDTCFNTCSSCEEQQG